MSQPLGPFKLVTVNTAPERAKELVGIVVNDLKERFVILHEANCSSMFVIIGHLALVTASNTAWKLIRHSYR